VPAQVPLSQEIINIKPSRGLPSHLAHRSVAGTQPRAGGDLSRVSQEGAEPETKRRALVLHLIASMTT